MDKEETEYMLRWSEHSAQVMATFTQLWELGQLTDVTLATEERVFQAHRALLAACSPYFRQLFVTIPSQDHPTVFLKDVSAGHLELLLQYVYRGRIAVKHSELAEVLRTASSLRIRGLTTGGLEEAASNIPEEIAEDREDRLLTALETASTASAASGASATSHRRQTQESGGSQPSGGRKSSKPKKLRVLSGGCDTEDSGVETRDNIPPCTTDRDNTLPCAEPETDEEKELVIDQPVDFSSGKAEQQTSAKTSNNSTSLDSKYSILGSYLKASKGAGQDKLGGRGSGWMLNSLSHLSAPRPASRDSRGYSKEEEEDALMDSDTKDYPQLSLSETMGMGDIAERLRTHFLSNLPTLTPGSQLGGYGWLTNGHNALLDKVKREKHPSGAGGIKTDMIGPNGKAAVKCEECGKLLADPSSLYRHRKIHTGEKPHKCPYCDRRFIQRFNMKQHIKTHRIELLAEQNAAAAATLSFAQ